MGQDKQLTELEKAAVRAKVDAATDVLKGCAESTDAKGRIVIDPEVFARRMAEHWANLVAQSQSASGDAVDELVHRARGKYGEAEKRKARAQTKDLNL